MEGYIFVGTGIQQLTIPKNTNTINGTTFHEKNIDITIAEDNQTYKSIDNMYIVSKDNKTLKVVSKDKAEYTIPDTIETIDTNAFYNKRQMKTIILPNGIKTIKEVAFDFCINLTKIEIPSSIETIGSNAFSRCNSLSEILIYKPEGSISGALWGAPYGLRAIKWNT